jgi:hypothetical protein
MHSTMLLVDFAIIFKLSLVLLGLQHVLGGMIDGSSLYIYLPRVFDFMTFTLYVAHMP